MLEHVLNEITASGGAWRIGGESGMDGLALCGAPLCVSPGPVPVALRLGVRARCQQLQQK